MPGCPAVKGNEALSEKKSAIAVPSLFIYSRILATRV
jgi:hypothetical protein